MFHESTNFTVTLSGYYLVDSSSGDMHITLPDCTTVGVEAQVFGFINNDGHFLILEPVNGQTILDVASYKVALRAACSIVSDGARWVIITAPAILQEIDYNGTTLQYNIVRWKGTATTTSGVATFHPTVDGTTATVSQFTNIFNVNAIAQINTSTRTTVPYAGIKAISGDRRTVTVNVVDANSFVPDGTLVYLLILGN